MIRLLMGLLLFPMIGQAQESGIGGGLYGQVIFWCGALAVVVLLSRSLFKEQFHERRTLRRLIDEIGPRYREFEIDVLKRWVHQCAPHVWRLYDRNELGDLHEFVTPHFRSNFETMGPQKLGPKGEKLIFEKLLKIHPLGLYMVEGEQPPKGIELMLRLEEKVKLFNPISIGNSDSERFIQVQTFWTLRHNGAAWCLDRVWQADGDVTDLVDRPQVPPVTEWSVE